MLDAMHRYRSQIAACALALLVPPAESAPPPPDASADETVAFFEAGAIPGIKVVLDEEAQRQLREHPRDYVRAALVVDGTTTLKTVGVKLKGAAGSYRDFDDRPALTVNVDKYKKGQRFHGMEKFHLNNAVQDETLLSEWLGSELFRAAGYPCPRAGHARLRINDRDLGVYVLREGFDEPFLKRTFPDAQGHLYDGGFLQDVDTELEMDAGDDPDDRADLLGLAIACHEPDPAVRWKGMAARIDLDRFVTFMALERLCGHWDGYTMNQNNYRLYFPPGGRGVFLPHGLDQLFGDPGAGLYDPASPQLSAAVLQNDAWRGKYRQELEKLRPLFQPADGWVAKVDAMRARLQPVLESVDADLAAQHGERVAELNQRLRDRAEALEELITNGCPEPLAFDTQGVARIEDWQAACDAEGAKLEEVDAGGVGAYLITREPFGDYEGSWRTAVLLPRGRYRFEARLKTEQVIPIVDDGARGAGVRMSGAGRSHGFTGSNDWRPVGFEIDVREDQRNVELVLELRARHGRVWFDRSALVLRRLKER
jgi:spore coat protein H